MEQNILSVEKRQIFGRISARKIRREGRTPAIIYGKGLRNAIPVNVNIEELKELLKQGGKGMNLLLTLKADNPDINGKIVVVKDYDINPVSREVEHVDFYEISLEHRIKIKVPLELTGKAMGVTMGGILEHVRRELEVECLPGNIPDKIVVDVTDLKLGHSIHVMDIKLPEGVKVIADSNFAIAAVSVLKEEEAAPAAVPGLLGQEGGGRRGRRGKD